MKLVGTVSVNFDVTHRMITAFVVRLENKMVLH